MAKGYVNEKWLRNAGRGIRYFRAHTVHDSTNVVDVRTVMRIRAVVNNFSHDNVYDLNLNIQILVPTLEMLKFLSSEFQIIN